jgi:hypothetical protein
LLPLPAKVILSNINVTLHKLKWLAQDFGLSKPGPNAVFLTFAATVPTCSLFVDCPIILAIGDQQQTAFRPTFSPPFVILNVVPSMNIPQILPAVFSDYSTQALFESIP